MSLLYDLRDIRFAYDGAEVLRGITLSFRAGEFVGIAGPNGAGKSTLLHVMSGLLMPASGECRFRATPVRQWDRKSFARHVAVVTQNVQVEFPFTAEQVVLMGRTPFADSLFESKEDAEQVERAMELTGTTSFRRRDFRTLSGGEKQRVILASALAQSPRVLLLDEPTAYLDLEHQVSLYRLLAHLCEQGLLVVAITHDLNLAAIHSDRMIMLNHGEIAADGPPSEVLTAATLQDVFHVSAQILTGPHGRPWIHYGA